MNLIIIIAVIIFSSISFGQISDYIRGYELEFSSPEIDDEFENLSKEDQDTGITSTPVTRKFRTKFKDAIIASCPECSVTSTKDRYNIIKYEVKYPDGSGFDVTLDPGVIEIVFQPLTGSKLRELSLKLQRDIFDNAKKTGLKPFKGPSSLHASISMDAFANNPVFLHNTLKRLH